MNLVWKKVEHRGQTQILQKYLHIVIEKNIMNSVRQEKLGYEIHRMR